MEKKHRRSIQKQKRPPLTLGGRLGPLQCILAEGDPLVILRFLGEKLEAERESGVDMFAHQSSVQQIFMQTAWDHTQVCDCRHAACALSLRSLSIKCNHETV